jgi:hypothetical protein
MNRRTFLSTMVTAGFATQLGGCSWVSDRFRCRVTINVEVDGQPTSGSSIIEVNVHKMIAGPTTFNTPGVTPIINLGKYGSLIFPVSGSPGFAKNDPDTQSLQDLVIFQLRPKDWSTKEPVKGQDYSYLNMTKIATTVKEPTYPIMRWFPPDADEKSIPVVIRRIELINMTGGNVRYKSTIIEPSHASLITELSQIEMTDPPRWLAKKNRNKS